VKTFAIIQHQANEDEGFIREWLASHNLSVRRWRVWHEPTFMSPAQLSAIIILGGEANVKDREQLDWMQREYAWLQSAIQHKVPCFGICLGAQILASILGASVRRLETPEKGVFPLKLHRSAWLKDFPLESLMVNQAHAFRFDIPEHGKNLASSHLCEEQLFVDNSERIMGMQCHLEWSEETMARLFPDLMSQTDIPPLQEKEARALLFHLLDKFFIH